jgi:hypothetical protein
MYFILYQIKSSAWRDANEVNRLAIQPVSDEMLHAFYYEIRGRDKQGCPSEYDDDDLHCQEQCQVFYSNLNEITHRKTITLMCKIFLFLSHIIIIKFCQFRWVNGEPPEAFLGRQSPLQMLSQPFECTLFKCWKVL